MDKDYKNMDGLIERNVKLSDNSGLGNVSDIIRNREVMSYEDEARSNPMLLDLARQAEIKKLIDHDKPIEDMSGMFLPAAKVLNTRNIIYSNMGKDMYNVTENAIQKAGNEIIDKTRYGNTYSDIANYAQNR